MTCHKTLKENRTRTKRNSAENKPTHTYNVRPFAFLRKRHVRMNSSFFGV